MTTLHNITTFAGWKAMREVPEFAVISGTILVCAVSDRGALHVVAWNYTRDRGEATMRQRWFGGTSLTLPTPVGHELRPFRGRPSILQSDYGLDEVGEISGLFGDRAEYGNIEVVAPAKGGGILHFWRQNGVHSNDSRMDEGWSFGGSFGDAVYDEVSLLQTRFGEGKNGNLELIARRVGQRGFDFFWREPDFVWRGPVPIEAP